MLFRARKNYKKKKKIRYPFRFRLDFLGSGSKTGMNCAVYINKTEKFDLPYKIGTGLETAVYCQIGDSRRIAFGGR